MIPTIKTPKETRQNQVTHEPGENGMPFSTKPNMLLACSEEASERNTQRPDQSLVATPHETSVKLKVIGNHAGHGAAGSAYNEGRVIAQVLARQGHITNLFDPVSGFNGSVTNGEKVVVATQPEKYNSLLQDFVARRPQVEIAWRVGWAQDRLFEDILDLAKVTVVQMCLEKAYRLTGFMSRPDSALALNAYRPETLIVVSDCGGASACRYGRVITVLSQRVDKPRQHDGMGAAFFGGFLGELLKSGNLPVSLAVGHHFGAAVAMGVWPVPGASTSE